MNRAERRKAKKSGIITGKNGEKTYTFNQRQLDNFVTEVLMQQRREIVESITAEFIRVMFLTCSEVLNFHFGFGRRRLSKFKYFVENLCNSIEGGYVTLDEIESGLAEKMNIDFLKSDVKIHEIYSPKEVGEMEILEPYPTEDESEGGNESE